jgi:hypothetical protein
MHVVETVWMVSIEFVWTQLKNAFRTFKHSFRTCPEEHVNVTGYCRPHPQLSSQSVLRVCEGRVSCMTMSYSVDLTGLPDHVCAHQVSSRPDRWTFSAIPVRST